MMDRLTIEAAEAAVQANYPKGARAVLIVELDGVAEQVEDDLAAVRQMCEANGAFEIRVAADGAERELLWKGRKSAFAAMGRISASYYVQDGVVPRTKLPGVLRQIARLEREYGLVACHDLRAVFPGLRFLHLYRENKVLQAIGPSRVGSACSQYGSLSNEKPTHRPGAPLTSLATSVSGPSRERSSCPIARVKRSTS